MILLRMWTSQVLYLLFVYEFFMYAISLSKEGGSQAQNK